MGWHWHDNMDFCTEHHALRVQCYTLSCQSQPIYELSFIEMPASKRLFGALKACAEQYTG